MSVFDQVGSILRDTFTGEKPVDVPLERLRHITAVATRYLYNGLTAHPGAEAVDQPDLPPWTARQGEVAKVIPIRGQVSVEGVPTQTGAPATEVSAVPNQVGDASGGTVLAFRARSGEVAMGPTVDTPAMPQPPIVPETPEMAA